MKHVFTDAAKSKLAKCCDCLFPVAAPEKRSQMIGETYQMGMPLNGCDTYFTDSPVGQAWRKPLGQLYRRNHPGGRPSC